MLTFSQLGQAKQTVQKSRFFAYAQSCHTERELALFLRYIMNEHPDSHHLAYAFRLNTTHGIVAKFSDAGEPSGVAGKPILQMLEGQQLINCCVAVIRYYGGINLGKGGLARAYGGTAKLAMDSAQAITYVEMVTIQLSVPYARTDELFKEVTQLNGKILDKQFNEQAHFVLHLPVEKLSNIQSKYAIK